MSFLDDLQKWYTSNCDGDWEEEWGVHISTLDNPGWSVKIDLVDTNLEGKEFQPVKIHESPTSWLDCTVKDKQFQGFGDQTRLEEILTIFVTWAKSQNEDWLKPPPPMTMEEAEQYDDEQFFDSLKDEVPEIEKCRKEGCVRNRIKHSVMCREHHFEMVTKRPAPRSVD